MNQKICHLYRKEEGNLTKKEIIRDVGTMLNRMKQPLLWLNLKLCKVGDFCTNVLVEIQKYRKFFFSTYVVVVERKRKCLKFEFKSACHYGAKKLLKKFQIR
jgi:hypothetical protein